jgi:signal transduction histidine kinase
MNGPPLWRFLETPSLSSAFLIEKNAFQLVASFVASVLFSRASFTTFLGFFTFFHVPYVGRDCRTQLFLVFMWVHSMVITVTCHSSDAHLQLFFQRCSASTEVIQKQMTLREEVELQPGRGKKRIYLQFLAKRSTYF